MSAPDDDARARRVGAAIEALSATLLTAQALAAGRRRLDLAGLDDQAGRVCAQLLDLAPDCARALRPGLWRLLDQVDALMPALAPR